MRRRIQGSFCALYVSSQHWLGPVRIVSALARRGLACCSQVKGQNLAAANSRSNMAAPNQWLPSSLGMRCRAVTLPHATPALQGLAQGAAGACVQWPCSTPTRTNSTACHARRRRKNESLDGEVTFFDEGPLRAPSLRARTPAIRQMQLERQLKQAQAAPPTAKPISPPSVQPHSDFVRGAAPSGPDAVTAAAPPTPPAAPASKASAANAAQRTPVASTATTTLVREPAGPSTAAGATQQVAQGMQETGNGGLLPIDSTSNATAAVAQQNAVQQEGEERRCLLRMGGGNGV
jgi:hypothetical protein